MTTRQQLIIDLVEKYKREFPEEYRIVCAAVRKDRHQKRGDKKTSLRKAMSIPESLFKSFNFFIGNPRIFSDSPIGEREVRWFAKKFPEFLIPNNL